ncbi:hypothetical protein D3Z53_15710 [Lachnospiraceae bacterium]|jgi:hypothetical protein|nr:DUF6063 family protein [uncultured Schaedlerella sp.]EOS39152.1 hypothetical protein C808_02007 [Lachnospiraceae bacterium M18-1]MCI9152618.1 hypothetical protein [Ruminococcus sp.]NBI59471.1 hypothetical protein [Lachnospiraceae bacterium]
MAYEFGDIRISQEIFYYLLEHHELREDEEVLLFKAYAEQEEIQNLVKSQGEAAYSTIERYGNVIYLIPKEENHFLGFSKAQLKNVLCRSNSTDKDYYLSQFVILTLLVEFFDGQGSSSKAREYMRVGELQNCISRRLKEGAEHVPEDQEEQAGIAFSNMLEAYEALRSDEKGSRARTTKEGFLHHILTFLQKQGLVEYVEQDEMIKTTKKLDNFMDWNLLNQNNYKRVLRVLGVGKEV